MINRDVPTHTLHMQSIRLDATSKNMCYNVSMCRCKPTTEQAHTLAKEGTQKENTEFLESWQRLTRYSSGRTSHPATTGQGPTFMLRQKSSTAAPLGKLYQKRRCFDSTNNDVLGASAQRHCFVDHMEKALTVAGATERGNHKCSDSSVKT